MDISIEELKTLSQDRAKDYVRCHHGISIFALDGGQSPSLSGRALSNGFKYTVLDLAEPVAAQQTNP